MQLQQLKYFMAVVEHKSFSNAARALNISQPSLSQSIQALEQELGFVLLQRKRSGSQPTEMGALVYKDVCGIMRELEAKFLLWQETYRGKTALKDVVRIGCVPCDYSIMTELVVKRLAESFPNLQCKIIEARNWFLMDYLLEGQVDMVVCAYIGQQREKLEALVRRHKLQLVPLQNDNYKIAVNAGSDIALQDCLSRDECRKLSLSCYSGGDDVADLFLEDHFDRSLCVEYNSFEKMVQAAQDGLAVSVLPEWTTVNSRKLTGASKQQALRFLTVEGFCIPFKHYLCLPQARADEPALKVVCETIMKAFQSLPAVG